LARPRGTSSAAGAAARRQRLRTRRCPTSQRHRHTRQFHHTRPSTFRREAGGFSRRSSSPGPPAHRIRCQIRASPHWTRKTSPALKSRSIHPSCRLTPVTRQSPPRFSTPPISRTASGAPPAQWLRLPALEPPMPCRLIGIPAACLAILGSRPVCRPTQVAARTLRARSIPATLPTLVDKVARGASSPHHRRNLPKRLTQPGCLGKGQGRRSRWTPPGRLLRTPQAQHSSQCLVTPAFCQSALKMRRKPSDHPIRQRVRPAQASPLFPRTPLPRPRHLVTFLRRSQAQARARRSRRARQRFPPSPATPTSGRLAQRTSPIRRALSIPAGCRATSQGRRHRPGHWAAA